MLTPQQSVPGGFSRAAVVGAGLMGRRIAGVLASAGLDVVITDTNAGILEAAAAEAGQVAAPAAVR
jgi:3-hydroxybutyryl-CoA dehydrogenase